MTTWRGEARRGEARRDEARRGEARRDEARRGRRRQRASKERVREGQQISASNANAQKNKKSARHERTTKKPPKMNDIATAVRRLGGRDSQAPAVCVMIVRTTILLHGRTTRTRARSLTFALSNRIKSAECTRRAVESASRRQAASFCLHTQELERKKCCSLLFVSSGADYDNNNKIYNDKRQDFFARV